MSVSWHDLIRPWRLLGRRARYSRLVYGARRAAVVRAELEQIYQATNHFLHSLEVEYWLAYGTLLGYYREGGVIAGDYDVDFGASLSAYRVIWAARRQLPAGFKMYDTSHRHRGPKLYVTWHGWEADIYFYEAAGDQLLSLEKRPWAGDRQPFPRGQIYPIHPAIFLGAPTYIPNDPLVHLVHMYGYIGADGIKDPRTGYWSKKISARP